MLGAGVSPTGLIVLGRRRALLDDYVDRVVEPFAFRRVLSSARPLCIVARRTSDNDEEEFGFGGDDWLNTSAIKSWAGSASAFITRIVGQLTGREVVQTNTGLQPRIVNAGTLDVAPNGRPIMVMTGSKVLSSALVSTGVPSGAADMSLVLASTLAPANGAGTWRVGQSYGGTANFSDPAIGLDPSNRIAAMAVGGSGPSIAIPASTAIRFCAADFKAGASAALYLDALSAGPSAFAYNIANPGRFVIGGRPLGGVAWGDAIGEALFLTGTTPELRALLRADYQSVWSTP